MKNLMELFFVLSSMNKDEKDGNFILCSFQKEENDYIFFSKKESEILKRLDEIEKEDKIIDIYISNDVSINLIENIHKNHDCIIWLNNSNNFNFDYIKNCDDMFKKGESVAKSILKIKKICDNEYEFNKFYSELLNRKNNSTEIIESLINENILNIDDNKNIVLSFYGKILFSKEFDDFRRVEIVEKEINNHLIYSKNIELSDELINLREKITNYIYNHLPDLQFRNNKVSIIRKTIEKEDLQMVVDYVLSINKYEEISPIKIEITPIGIEFSYIIDKNNSLNNFFIKYLNLLSLEVIKNIFQQKGYLIENKNKGNISCISLIFVEEIEEFDISFDKIDYQIIDIANRINFFNRELIDTNLGISPRNSNNHLNKLIEKGILDRIGNGKAIKYFKVIN